MLAIQPFLNKISEHIINPLIAVLFSVATVIFIWGVVKMIWYGESEEARATGKRNMMYGIIGMVIMTSVFFLMQMIVNTFDLTAPEGDILEPIRNE